MPKHLKFKLNLGDSMFEIVIEMRFYIKYFSHNFSLENGYFLLEKGLKMALNGLKW